MGRNRGNTYFFRAAHRIFSDLVEWLSRWTAPVVVQKVPGSIPGDVTFFKPIPESAKKMGHVRENTHLYSRFKLDFRRFSRVVKQVDCTRGPSEGTRFESRRSNEGVLRRDKKNVEKSQNYS